MTDWNAWHEPYADPDSDLSRRLAIVRRLLEEALSRASTGQPVSLISLCAGDGRDVIGVLERGGHASPLRGLLVEYDERLVAAANAAISAANLGDQVTMRQGDAADTGHYADLVPADIVLMCGVFGNVSDADVFRLVDSLPQLVRTGGTCIWTRSRRSPDLTPAIRAALGDAGFAELSFEAPDDALFTVGAGRFDGVPQHFVAQHLFKFIRS